MNSSTGYLREDGTPNLPLLIDTFNRCTAPMAGGLEWLDQVRNCQWPNQWTDGRKHNAPGDPNGDAKPWDNASDCRPFTVDDIINEIKATLTASFWRAMVNPGSAASEESGYAVALVEWLVFTKMLAQLVDEVELSADYMQHVGWCLLAPRWKREVGLRRHTVKLALIQAAADREIAEAQQQQRPPGRIAELPTLILDPTQEEAAVEFIQGWYDQFVLGTLPEDLRARAPKTTAAVARKVVRALRTDGTATAPLPYLCANEPTIEALLPYDEAFIPPELTSENELVFQVERVSEATLRGRELGMNYDPEWIEAALKHKGAWSTLSLPIGTSGQALQRMGGTATPSTPAPGNDAGVTSGQVEVIYAVYRAADEYGIPATYCTTFHREVTKRERSTADLYALHELVESHEQGLPYVAMLREKRKRAITSSRGVTELAHTDQNLIKGHLDSTLDLASLSVLPPLNVYESPTGDNRQFVYAPGIKNFTKAGREPQLMELSNRGGMINGMEAMMLLTKRFENRFGALSDDVPPVRQQLKQEQGVRRHTVAWTLAFKQVLCLYQKYGDDAEFARVTGAPAGWLEAHREQPGLLSCVLDFDVRELDPEMELKRVEAMNKIVLPNDVLGVVNRGAWAADMTRSILGPRRAKLLVRSQPEANAALRDKARGEVAQMFLGNAPGYLDDKDPTAGGLLQLTKETVLQNQVYLAALDDEALVAITGGVSQAQQVLAQLQQMGQARNPNERFSKLLLKWLENLQFIGVTQVQNKQIGRLGVNPQGTE